MDCSTGSKIKLKFIKKLKRSQSSKGQNVQKVRELASSKSSKAFQKSLNVVTMLTISAQYFQLSIFNFLKS